MQAKLSNNGTSTQQEKITQLRTQSWEALGLRVSCFRKHIALLESQGNGFDILAIHGSCKHQNHLFAKEVKDLSKKEGLEF